MSGKWLVLCLLACAGVLGFFLMTKPNNTVQTEIKDRELVSLEIAEQSLEVEVVTTAENTAQGLSGREEIGSDGMLFLFPQSRIRSFWMKEMRFPIDIIWINHGVVIGVAPAVPPPEPGQSLEALPRYISPAPADTVLEVPAGYAAEHGIQTGSPVHIARDTRKVLP